MKPVTTMNTIYATAPRATQSAGDMTGAFQNGTLSSILPSSLPYPKAFREGQAKQIEPHRSHPAHRDEEDPPQEEPLSALEKKKRKEFHIPATPAGNLVCRLPLVWGLVNGKKQPCILMEGVRYPDFALIEERN